MLQQIVIRENDDRVNFDTSFTEHLIPGDYFFGWQAGFFDNDFVRKFDMTEIHNQVQVSDLRWNMFCDALDFLTENYPGVKFTVEVNNVEPSNKHALHVRRQGHRAYVLYCKGHKKLAHRVLDALLSREELNRYC